MKIKLGLDKDGRDTYRKHEFVIPLQNSAKSRTRCRLIQIIQKEN